MDDLFRFVLLRPAEPPKPDRVKALGASYVEKGTSHELAKRAALEFAKNKSFILNPDELAYASAARAVTALLRGGPAPAATISETVASVVKKSAASVVADKKFVAEEVRLADTLVTIKLLSNSSGADAPALLEIAQGYEAIRLATSGRDPTSLPVLFVDDILVTRTASEPSSPAVMQPAPSPQTHDLVGPQKKIQKLDAALAVLGTLPAEAFEASSARETETAQLRLLDSRLTALERPNETAIRSTGSATPITANARAWMLSAKTISELPSSLRDTLSEFNIVLTTQTLPMALNALSIQKSRKMLILEKQKTESVVPAMGSNDYVGTPSAPMRTSHGNIRPVGIGDLLLVKQHVLRYQGGDLAHVENVLKSEHMSRETRRLERTETTILRETETTKEETRDTQTTDRFSLKRETSDTIKTDTSFKAGLSVSAKYGPFVEVKANADFATSTSTEASTKQATEFSKDVVARSASKLVERVLERRSTTTINEFRGEVFAWFR